jgi:flagellar basal-body rod protein FlgB
MQAATDRAPGAPLARTAAAHLTSTAGDAAAGPVLYRNAVQPSLDGNTVDMDVERAQFAENAIHYEANLMIINSQLKALLSAIQG